MGDAKTSAVRAPVAGSAAIVLRRVADSSEPAIAQLAQVRQTGKAR
jgi:hypothetical protein